MDATNNVGDVGGVRRFEVLIPRLRRRGLLAGIEARCEAAGVHCDVRKVGQGSSKRKVLILSVPAAVSDHAFARLSSWIYVRVGTRPNDLSEAAERATRLEAMDAAQGTAWTVRDLEFVVGRMVRKEFLDGVGAICAAAGVRGECRTERRGLIRTTVVTVSGPRSLVDQAAGQLLDWQRRFPAHADG
jgi:hypothetical protein